MILTIDVGNTNITCGVFQGDEIAASFRITTKMPRTVPMGSQSPLFTR